MKPRTSLLSLSVVLALSLSLPLAGCSKPSPPPSTPQRAPYGYVPPPGQKRAGMSTSKKLALLAGAAALVYLYNKHKNAKGPGAQGQYYLSKNGRVYYRDARGNAVWVTPPKEGIQVPQEEAEMYRRAAQTRNWNVGPASAPRPISRPAFATPTVPPGPPGPRR